MKIGIDARLIHETGVGRYIRNIIRHLTILDTHNTYYIYTKREAVSEVQSLMPKAVVRMCDVRWHTILEQLVIPFVFSRDDLDILHIPYFSVPILYSGRLIVTFHDLIPLHITTGKASTLPYPLYVIKRFIYQRIIAIAMKKACRIIAVSQTTKKEIVDHFPETKEKICVISEGVDESLLLYRGKKLDNPVRAPYFLYVGNVYPHKNVKTVLLAYQQMKILLPKTVHPQFIFIGKEDAFTKRIRNDALVHNDSSIHFLTDVSDRLLASYYSYAKALVFPSDMEGFGLPAIEAIAFGCPVILSDIPTFRELFPSVGLFAGPRDVDAFASHMSEALSGTVGKIPSSIQEQYLSAYRWQDAARQTLALYEDSHRV